MSRPYTMPRDFDRMPLGFYIRENKQGRWMIGGQKSELPGGEYRVVGPIKLPEKKITELNFDALQDSLAPLLRELKEALR